jgi:hypothetical protein
MQMFVSPNTVPVQLDKELNSSKSHVGLKKKHYEEHEYNFARQQ